MPLAGLVAGLVVAAIFVVVLLAAVVAVVAHKRRKGRRMPKYMSPMGESLVLENVVYDGAASWSSHVRAAGNPVYYNGEGCALI